MIESLKKELEKALKHREVLGEKFATAKENVDKARQAVREAERKRREAKQRMKNAYEQNSDDGSARYKNRIWRNYNRIEENNSSLIEILRYEAEDEKMRAEQCLMHAAEYNLSGNVDEAAVWLKKKFQHEETYNGIQAEIDDLQHGIDDARERAELEEVRCNNEDRPNCVETGFRTAKLAHDSALAQFKLMKTEYNRIKKEYKTAKVNCQRLERQLNQVTDSYGNSI